MNSKLVFIAGCIYRVTSLDKYVHRWINIVTSLDHFNTSLNDYNTSLNTSLNDCNTLFNNCNTSLNDCNTSLDKIPPAVGNDRQF